MSEPSTSLFIRTYRKDIEFLGCLFRSLDKFSSGWHEIVVHCDNADRQLVEHLVAKRARVVYATPQIAAGYLQQQLAKMTANRVCSGDIIQFIDSDCVATGPINPEHFRVNGKPQILHTPWSVIGNSAPWRPATEKAMGEPVESEFMRGMRLGYWRETLELASRAIEKRHGNLARFIERTQSFSEFNYLGAWAWKNHHDRYSWLDTTCEPLPYHNLRQFPSHHGVTPEIRAEIDRYLA